MAARTTPREHGTKACYVFGEWGGDSQNGCRCDLCRGSIARYEQERKARIEPAYVSAGPVREHLAWLSTQGIGWKRAAIAAGLSPSVVWKIVYGRNGEPSKRCRPSTAEKLLAVSLDAGADGSLVDAAPTWAHVRTLLGRGWTKGAISLAIGNQARGLQIGTDKIQRGTAAKIKALLAEPVPDTVGKAWSAHHKANAEPAPEPIVYDDKDRVILGLVEVLEERIDQTWRTQAACRGRKPWMWFPARGDSRTAEAALKVCGSCFVRAECLAANLHQRDGIYGGLSARARRDLRKEAAA